MTVQTEPAKEGKRGRASKEDMAYSITYLNDKNEESPRIPTVVTGVRVSATNGKSRVINLKDIPPQVLGQMAAFAVRSKLGTFLKDVTKPEVHKVMELADEFLKVAKDATLFIPKEGGGPGRAIDTDFWIAVVAKVAQLKIKAGVPNVQPMSDEAKEAFRIKLLSWTTDQRKEKQKQWEQDRTFRNAIVLVRAERVQAKMNEEGIGSNEEYNVLDDI